VRLFRVLEVFFAFALASDLASVSPKSNRREVIGFQFWGAAVLVVRSWGLQLRCLPLAQRRKASGKGLCEDVREPGALARRDGQPQEVARLDRGVGADRLGDRGGCNA